MDREAELIERVARLAGKREFFESAIVRDGLDDWKLAMEFGEFLVRLSPEEIMEHALLARACRHLGELQRAGDELRECRALEPHPEEKEMFLAFIADEEQKLRTLESE